MYVAVGIGSAALGFIAGYLVKARKDKVYLDAVIKRTQDSVNYLTAELNKLKGKDASETGADFDGDVSAISEFPWQNVNDKTGELPNESAVVDGVPTEKSELSFRIDPEERENYHAIVSGHLYVSEPEHLDTLIRYPGTTDDGTYEISEQEAEALKKDYPWEELAYYEASGKIFQDGGELDRDEVSPIIGYTIDELAKRFLKGDTNIIYMQNEAYRRIYVVESLNGLMPD